MSTVAELQQRVEAQGSKVRELKANKASKDEVKSEVTVLLALKAELKAAQEAAGESTDAGGAVGELTPWDAPDVVDYDKLVREFGASRISPELIERIEKCTGVPAHPWLKRGVFFSHRDLEAMVQLHEQGKSFYLYTGRGPSSEALHLGHLIPFRFTKWLQDAFKAPLVIQLTDDEKTLWKELELEEAHRLGYENSKDIIAMGFDPKKTFIFSDADYMPHMLPNILRIQKKVTFNQVRGMFGFDGTKNIGQVGFPAVQAAPSFSSSFPTVLANEADMPCLIPCAIDQDPYFKMTRDVAPRMGLKKPSLIHSIFFPALQGAQSKMSASNANSAVYVTDTADQIREKIFNHAFVGEPGPGEEPLAQHVPFQWLTFYLDDEEKLAEIKSGLIDGSVSSDQVKEELTVILQKIVADHQEARKKVTLETLDQFMAVRPLEY